MSDILLRDREGPLELLTLNDPDRANALSPSMVDALQSALAATAFDDEIRAVILAGAGRHFSAGADLESLERLSTGRDDRANETDSKMFERMYETLLEHPKLTVAAVHGAAIGGGCGLATACDFVVVEQTAHFAYTEITIGFIPALVSTFLTRRVPGSVARRLLLDPERVSGERAVEIGLADELVTEGEALGAAKAFALRIAHKVSPAALTATKRLLNETVGLGWREGLAVGTKANVEQRRHPECRRGVRTFLESKRTLDWLEPEDS